MGSGNNIQIDLFAFLNEQEGERLGQIMENLPKRWFGDMFFAWTGAGRV